LDRPPKRCCRRGRHRFRPNTAGISAVAARHAFDVLGLALADFDSRDNEALIMDAAARAMRPAADPCLVDLDMIPRLATEAVATGSDHAGAEFVEDLERRLVAVQAKLALGLDGRDAWRMARNEVGGPEPDRQRRAGPLHDR